MCSSSYGLTAAAAAAHAAAEVGVSMADGPAGAAACGMRVS